MTTQYKQEKNTCDKLFNKYWIEIELWKEVGQPKGQLPPMSHSVRPYRFMLSNIILLMLLLISGLAFETCRVKGHKTD